MELRVVTDKPATLRRGQTTQYPHLGGNHHESSHQHYDRFCRISYTRRSFISFWLFYSFSLFTWNEVLPRRAMHRRIGTEKLQMDTSRWIQNQRGGVSLPSLVVFEWWRVTLANKVTSACSVKRVQSSAWYNADLASLCRGQRLTRMTR